MIVYLSYRVNVESILRTVYVFAYIKLSLQKIHVHGVSIKSVVMLSVMRKKIYVKIEIK